ncbi:MAG: DNRLRE domain-containing protein [Planctomycetota bacterium]|jgi:tetratricopeptide (TPR) repeat protein
MRHPRLIALVLIGAVCAAAPTAAAQGAGARWWVYFESRESTAGKPPRLVLRTSKRTSTVKASADATVISYLPARVLGKSPRLAVGTNDRNRSLVRFELPKTLRKVRRAELVLDLKLSKLPPKQPFEIEVHQLMGAWQEASVNWNRQPRFQDQPAIAVSLLPKAGEVALDVTGVVNAWLTGKAQNHGLLLKMGGVPRGSTPLPAPKLTRDLLQTVPWRNDVEQARKEALETDRLLLACVRGAYRPAQQDPVEQLLQALVLTDPLVVALVKRRFVPVRVGYRPTNYTHGRVRGRDPLAPLGGDCTKIKAPALCISTADGKLVATLESLGTFDAAMIHAFLRRALAGTARKTKGKTAEELLLMGELAAAQAAFDKLEPPAAAKYGRARVAALEGDHGLAVRLALETQTARGNADVAADAKVQGGVSLMRRGDFVRATRLLSAALAMRPAPRRSAEARYYLGCLQLVGGQSEQALETWARLRREHPQSLWALRATARLAWPGRLGPMENLRAIPLGDGSYESTEQQVAAADVQRLVCRAVRYLLLHQRQDGSWTVEVRQYQTAITALIAKALLLWVGDLDADLAKQATAAVDKACTWLQAHIQNADARQASTFGGTYMLDLFLARHVADPSPASKRAVNKAIRFLLGGQCPDGAWSYSYQFGVNWKGGFGGWPRTDRGRTHSMNTGPALLFLTMAKAAGFRVKSSAMNKAADVLSDMRESAGVYTYTYPLPLNFRRPDQSIARGPVCEQALVACGKVENADLAEAMATFMKYRDGLRAPVKLDKSWATPHNFSSYFYFYAYYHAVLAIHALDDQNKSKMLRQLRADILAVPEMDATWVDYHQLGKPYGTAMALLILKLTE